MALFKTEFTNMKFLEALQRHKDPNVPRLPLGITMLMEDGHAASMKSRSRGLRRCRTGSSCWMEEIHMDMGRSCACFFTLESNMENVTGNDRSFYTVLLA